MNIKKKLLLALPLLGVAVGGLTALGSRSASVVEAADYSTSARDFELNTSDNSVSATFTVSNTDLDMKGWLICFLTEKPDYNLETRKLVGSDDYHPHLNDNCAHYFYAESTQRKGKMSITWAANAADQKYDLWNIKASYDDTENLEKYMTSEDDYHIVIGPRHTHNWAETSEIGNGKDHIWENCDYYVGKKSSLLHGVDGQTYLDLTGFTDWKNDNDKFAFYYWGGKNNGWSEFATPTEFSNIYVAQYSLGFVPTGMKAVRISSSAEAPSWDVDDNQGEDETFAEYGVIGIDGWNSSWSYAMAGIKFGENNIVTLDHFKRKSGHSENFNQYVSLAKNDTFVISLGDSTYNTYSTYETLTGNFKITDSEIEVLEGGIYSLYFNTDSHSLYITSFLMAELDEWSQSFLGDSCTDTKNNWDTTKNKYHTHLSKIEGATEYLRGVEHVAHDVKIDGYIAQAMQRYDFLVANFAGYSDYIGRSNSQNFTPYQSGAISLISKGGDATIIIIVSSITLAAFASLLIVRKKKRIK